MASDQTSHIRLAELLGALSRALDLVEGQPAGHCVRCCWIGIHIGQVIGLTQQQMADLYYTLLLKDLGCSSNAARICQLYLADDIAFKHDFKTVNGSLPQALRFVLSHTGMQAGLAARFRALINVMGNQGEIANDLMETRCQRGGSIARRMRFSEDVADGIRALDEHWDGAGLPTGIAGADIPIYSRIALLAQVIDVFHTANGRDAAITEVRHRSGAWFDPALVDAFERVAVSPLFWSRLASCDLQGTLLDLEPGRHTRIVDEDYLDDIAASFAEVIDSKSPFTAGHSERVTLYADLIAEEMRYSPERRRWLRRAGLLHDIGKLGVSNMVLDKPAKLDDDEWAQMKRHASHTETILSGIGAFEDMAAIAAAHHERLDGKGYPKGLAGDEIAPETRILTAADIFDAITADRPYRPAMPLERALSLMNDMQGTQIDPDCFKALCRALVKRRAGKRAA